ncbi:zinc finger protein 260 isoform X2 [Folsomia candida]|uniref:zinc finger protein 260 isoform X2 n=1 Tax=Folsomia candida TaxID=158441 RepID=UPI001604E4B0|nr:zinc finger protein 260 isoform X2 [Folsomia candida]
METCTFCGGHDPCVVPSPENGALLSYSASCVTSLLTVFHIDGADPVVAHLATGALTCADCLQLTRDIDLELRSLLKFLKNLDLLRSRLARRVKRAAAADATANSPFSATRYLNERIQQEIPLVNQAFETFWNLLRIKKRADDNKNPEEICKQDILIKDEALSDQESETNLANEIVLVGDGDKDATFTLDPVDKDATFALDPVDEDDFSDSDSSNYSPSSRDSSPEIDDSLSNPPPKKDATSSNSLQCPVCFKTFAKIASKNRHFRYHHDPTFTPFPCPGEGCDRVFAQSWHLKVHVERAHPGVSFPPRKKIRVEGDIVPKKERIPCPVESCDKSYARTQGMVVHMKVAHPEVPLPANYTPKSRRIRINPGVKEEVAEKLIRIFKKRILRRKPCPVCGKEVGSSSFSEHLRGHAGEKNHLCTKCGKLFRNARNLRLHDASVHIKERNFICAICGASFFRKEVLDNHVATIHERPADLRFSCDTCGKAYRHEKSLKEHVQMHTGKNLECPICSKVFNRKENVRLHLRTVHGGEKLIRNRKKTRGLEVEYRGE